MKLEDFKRLCRKPSGYYDYEKAAGICYDAKRKAAEEQLMHGTAWGTQWHLVDRYFLELCQAHGLDTSKTTRSTIDACFFFAKQH
jgi:hypothetical protein